MSGDDLRSVPILDLILTSAHRRAAHYREQAAQLRAMAQDARDTEMRSELLALAIKYDALANSVAK